MTMDSHSNHQSASNGYFLRDHGVVADLQAEALQRAKQVQHLSNGTAAAGRVPTALEALASELEAALARIHTTAGQVENFVDRTLGSSPTNGELAGEKSVVEAHPPHAERLASLSNMIHQRLTHLGHAVDRLERLA
jgi:hypothetical protein